MNMHQITLLLAMKRAHADEDIVATPSDPIGDGSMDFSDEDNSALIALLEDI